jgi:hypothetical protein
LQAEDLLVLRKFPAGVQNRFNSWRGITAQPLGAQERHFRTKPSGYSSDFLVFGADHHAINQFGLLGLPDGPGNQG